jgi:hypothetical protein
MNGILETFVLTLKSKEFHYAVAADRDLVVFSSAGKHLVWTTRVCATRDGSVVTLFSTLPVRIAPAKHAAIAKMIARINFGRRLGAFHLDLRDGEVLFCISSIVDGECCSEAAVEALIGTTCSAMDSGGWRLLKAACGETRQSSPRIRIDNRFSGEENRGLN